MVLADKNQLPPAPQPPNRPTTPGWHFITPGGVELTVESLFAGKQPGGKLLCSQAVEKILPSLAVDVL